MKKKAIDPRKQFNWDKEIDMFGSPLNGLHNCSAKCQVKAARKARKKPRLSLELQIMNAAGDALFAIMQDEKVADSLPTSIKTKINRWFHLTEKYLGKDSE